MDLMNIRRGLMMSMAVTSKDTVVIDDTTKILKMTVYGNKRASRLFDGSNLKVIYMDGVESLDAPYFFEYMPNLQAAIFPDVTSTVNYIFWDIFRDHAVPAIDFTKTVTFPNNTPFRLDQGCDVILRSDTMCTAGFTASTWGMTSGTKFYVPQSLISTYLNDANWGTFGASRILPIEGSKYENVNWWKSIS